MAAVVCGGSRGIGAAICRVLAANGYSVAVLSRSEAATSNTVRTLPTTKGNQHFGVSCNVRNADDVATTFARIVPELMKDVDVKNKMPLVLVNAAGVNVDGLLARSSFCDINQQIETNLLGSIYTSKAILRFMLRHGSGCIINVGSVIGSVGGTGQAAYSASKAGLVGFTKVQCAPACTIPLRYFERFETRNLAASSSAPHFNHSMKWEVDASGQMLWLQDLLIQT
eukprot:m.132973 g.132973  ORF g.132973 m.132973 type:complete len:226 (+) comp17516_c0_seq6:263-940(+)